MVEMFRILLVNACALLSQDLKDQNKCESGLTYCYYPLLYRGGIRAPKNSWHGNGEAALPSLEQHILWEWALDPPAATLGTW